MNAWHDKSLGETLSQLGTHRHRGLSDGEAKTRLDREVSFITTQELEDMYPEALPFAFWTS
jgi:hypothetical protein